MFSASTKSGRNSGATVDAQFNYVTMLLHGDGTNGAQNNTFLDSSTNNFTITRNGNTTQGSFSPYGSNWSNFFNGGNSDYLRVPNNAAFVYGTGDFTIETWLYFTTLSPAYQVIYDGRASAGADVSPVLLTNGSAISYYTASGFKINGGTLSINTWYHVALSRSSGSTKLFLNGVQTGSTYTDTNNYVQANDPFIGAASDGYAFYGYMSNYRVVKGTAVYTSAFTPPTAPLTAISGTSLLTCQSNRFIDNSTNNFTITVNGTISIQRFNPFGTSTAYSTSVIGGSGYFDGSGDYLTVPTTTALSFGTGDFTIEGWVYKTVAANASFVDGRVNPGTASPWGFFVDGSNFPYFYDGSVYTSSVALTLNSWSHIVAVRTSGTLKIFVNGVQGYSASLSTNLDRTAGAFIGVAANTSNLSAYWQGYMNDLRIVKGTAVYTTTFTPPTAPLTAITNTSLLLNYTNAGILDNAMMNDLETVGNAQISTSVKKYGTGSMAFDGTGDYLPFVNRLTTDFGTGDFTVECWVYKTTSSGADQVIIDARAANSATPWLISITNANTIYFYNGTTYTTSSSISLNTWSHIAVSRSSGTLKIFIDGVSGFSGSVTANLDKNVGGKIGSDVAGSAVLNGYIDDFRITKGYARYTTTFTPPTAAFPNTGPY